MSGKITPQQFFRAAQSPSNWLLTAERLQQAAEVQIAHEDQFLVPYLRAHDDATKVAMADAYSPGKKAGHAEVLARAPNYPPAQLLYAYAIENALKGLIITNDPNLSNPDKLDKTLQDHDLVELAKRAGLDVYVEEQPILEALSDLSTWAGRYPVPLYAGDFVGKMNSDELMDYGSRHTTMRQFYKRAYKALEAALPSPITTRNSSIVVFRQPGT